MTLIRKPSLTIAAAMLLAWALPASAQTTPAQTPPPQGPAVSMNVTAPGGQAKDLTTHESGLATLEVSGHTYGFRPTMWDDAGKRMTITIFDMGGAGQAVKEIGEVEVTGGASAVASKTTPSFKIAARKGGQTDTRPAQTSRG
jgi:hypothetical protein